MEKFLTRLLELFEESIVLQGFITVAFVGTYCYSVIAGRDISADLTELTKYVLIFWFGTKSQAAVSSTLRRLGNGRSARSPNPDSGAVAVDSNS